MGIDFNENLAKKFPIDECIKLYKDLYMDPYIIATPNQVPDNLEIEDRYIEKLFGLAILKTIEKMEIKEVTLVGRALDEKNHGDSNYSRYHAIYVKKDKFSMLLNLGWRGTYVKFFKENVDRDLEVTGGAVRAFFEIEQQRSKETKLHSYGIIPITSKLVDEANKMVCSLGEENPQWYRKYAFDIKKEEYTDKDQLKIFFEELDINLEYLKQDDHLSKHYSNTQVYTNAQTKLKQLIENLTNIAAGHLSEENFYTYCEGAYRLKKIGDEYIKEDVQCIDIKFEESNTRRLGNCDIQVDLISRDTGYQVFIKFCENNSTQYFLALPLCRKNGIVADHAVPFSCASAVKVKVTSPLEEILSPLKGWYNYYNHEYFYKKLVDEIRSLKETNKKECDYKKIEENLGRLKSQIEDSANGMRINIPNLNELSKGLTDLGTQNDQSVSQAAGTFQERVIGVIKKQEDHLVIRQYIEDIIYGKTIDPEAKEKFTESYIRLFLGANVPWKNFKSHYNEVDNNKVCSLEDVAVKLIMKLLMNHSLELLDFKAVYNDFLTNNPDKPKDFFSKPAIQNELKNIKVKKIGGIPVENCRLANLLGENHLNNLCTQIKATILHLQAAGESKLEDILSCFLKHTYERFKHEEKVIMFFDDTKKLFPWVFIDSYFPNWKPKNVTLSEYGLRYFKDLKYDNQYKKFEEELIAYAKKNEANLQLVSEDCEFIADKVLMSKQIELSQEILTEKEKLYEYLEIIDLSAKEFVGLASLYQNRLHLSKNLEAVDYKLALEKSKSKNLNNFTVFLDLLKSSNSFNNSDTCSTYQANFQGSSKESQQSNNNDFPSATRVDKQTTSNECKQIDHNLHSSGNDEKNSSSNFKCNAEKNNADNEATNETLNLNSGETNSNEENKSHSKSDCPQGNNSNSISASPSVKPNTNNEKLNLTIDRFPFPFKQIYLVRKEDKYYPRILDTYDITKLPKISSDQIEQKKFEDGSFIIPGEGGRSGVKLKSGKLYIEYEPGGKGFFNLNIQLISQTEKSVAPFLSLYSGRLKGLDFDDLMPFSSSSYYKSKTSDSLMLSWPDIKNFKNDIKKIGSSIIVSLELKKLFDRLNEQLPSDEETFNNLKGWSIDSKIIDHIDSKIIEHIDVESKGILGSSGKLKSWHKFVLKIKCLPYVYVIRKGITKLMQLEVGQYNLNTAKFPIDIEENDDEVEEAIKKASEMLNYNIEASSTHQVKLQRNDVTCSQSNDSGFTSASPSDVQNTSSKSRNQLDYNFHDNKKNSSSNYKAVEINDDNEATNEKLNLNNKEINSNEKVNFYRNSRDAARSNDSGFTSASGEKENTQNKFHKQLDYKPPLPDDKKNSSSETKCHAEEAEKNNGCNEATNEKLNLNNKEINSNDEVVQRNSGDVPASNNSDFTCSLQSNKSIIIVENLEKEIKKIIERMENLQDECRGKIFGGGTEFIDDKGKKWRIPKGTAEILEAYKKYKSQELNLDKTIEGLKEIIKKSKNRKFNTWFFRSTEVQSCYVRFNAMCNTYKSLPNKV